MQSQIQSYQKTLNRLLFFILIVALSGCTSTQPSQRQTVKKKSWTGFDLLNIKVGSQERSYLLHIPVSYTGQSPFPLVFDFHGTGRNPYDEIRYSDFASLAEEKGFILVAPAGLYKSYGRASWNTILDPSGVDDIAMVKKIIKKTSQNLRIDKKRIFVTGMSGGARMSSRVACELSETIAAMAPVAGIQFPNDCAPTRAMPLITFHGEEDLVNHYVHQKNSRTYWKKGVEDSVQGWVTRNGCAKNPQIDKISEVITKQTWKKCHGGAEVVFYQIENGGHTWPGSPIIHTALWAGNTNTDIIASDLIWEFFKAHPLP